MKKRAYNYQSLVTLAQAQITRWQKLCDKYLPIALEDTIWRLSRAPSDGKPEQGWKLHVSATVLSANKVLERVAPLLSKQGVLFKAPHSLEELGNLNGGLFYGFSQVGKFITVYPKDDTEAVQLAHKLHRLTCKLPGPAVPFDLRFRPDSLVHYRYGSFVTLQMLQLDGTNVPAIKDPEGNFIPDRRAPGEAAPHWVSNPFPRSYNRRSKSLLKTTYRAYEAISQRGKGGVYRALDVSVSPAQFCIIKEGRKNGETAWDGRDGYWRVRHEASVLGRLSQAGVSVPRVHAAFQSGRNFYLIMEFVEGENLNAFLQRKAGKIPLSMAVSLGRQLARLLDKIHSAGWVWRDCKPQNMIFTKAGDLRALDFEGACPVDRPDMTRWGTPGYAPPEWLYEPVSGSRLPEDLFALGAVLHQLVTGRIPNEKEPAPPIRKLKRRSAPMLQEIISALLDPAPGSRPDAVTVVKALEAVGSAGIK